MDYGVQYNKHVVLELCNELHLMKNKKRKEIYARINCISVIQTLLKRMKMFLKLLKSFGAIFTLPTNKCDSVFTNNEGHNVIRG